MINIQIAEAFKDTMPVSQELLLAAAQQTLKHEQPLADKLAGSGDIDLTLVITDDQEVHALNRQYRDVDATTDVLSFSMGDVDPDSGNLYLGDIVISLERALAQSQSQQHSILDELRLLVVHGVLHLLGYDHADEEEMAAMWAAQNEILEQLSSDEGDYLNL